MAANAAAIKAVVERASPEQRAAVRSFTAAFKGDLRISRDRAYFVVGWLTLHGESPQSWQRRRLGR